MDGDFCHFLSPLLCCVGGMFFGSIMRIVYLGFLFLSKAVIRPSIFGVFIFSHICASLFICFYLFLVLVCVSNCLFFLLAM